MRLPAAFITVSKRGSGRVKPKKYVAKRAKTAAGRKGAKKPLRYIKRTMMALVLAGLTVFLLTHPKGHQLTEEMQAYYDGVLYRVSQSSGLVLHGITIKGIYYLLAEEVEAVIPGDQAFWHNGNKIPLMQIDLQALQRRVEAIGWVKSAHVTRRLPDHLSIEIEERIAVALWHRQGAFYLLDGSGYVIAPYRRHEKAQYDVFETLLLVEGEQAPEQFPMLLQALQQHPLLFASLDAVYRVGNRRWNIRLRDGMVVLLPEQRVDQALAQLVEWHAQHQLLSRKIKTLDLRVENRLFIVPK